MIIQVDQEGKSVIEQFCDIALKQGGIKNLNQINLVLSTMVLISKPLMKPLPTQQPDQPKESEQLKENE